MGQETPLSLFPLSLSGHDLGRSFSGKGNTRDFPSEPPGGLRSRGSQEAESKRLLCVCLESHLNGGVSLQGRLAESVWVMWARDSSCIDEAVLAVGSGSPLALWEILMVR